MTLDTLLESQEDIMDIQKTASLEDTSTFKESLNALNLPEPIRALKEKAWERFEELPVPTRKNEAWRFSNWMKESSVSFDVQSVLEEVDKETLQKRSSLLSDAVGTFIFANNQDVYQSALPQELMDQGVIWEPLHVAFQKHPELLQKYFKSSGTELESEKYQALHAAYAQSGTFLYIPKGVEIKQHFVAYHWIHGEGVAVFPSTVIVAEDHAKVSLVDFYLSSSESQSGFSCGTCQLYAGVGAQVFRKSVQALNEASLCYQLDLSEAGKDSVIKTLSVQLGAKKSRFENQIEMAGPGSDLHMYALTVAENNQEFDQRTLQIHTAPNAHSNLLYKNALLDKAHTIFSGLIKVGEQAQQTDAYQTNRNLLLSPDAEANSLPGLEIEANDVKCSHGATTGKLEPRELFYMLSRGITKRKAQELMVFGFFEEVIQNLDSQELADLVRHFVHQKFQKKTIL